MSGKSLKTFVIAAIALWGAVGLIGCKDKDLYVFKPEFSVNVFYPSPKWPNAKKFTDVEKEVYERYGRPAAFRVLWPPTGDIRLRSDLENAFAKQNKVIPAFSWVYPNQNKEIAFTPTSYEERPLTDKIRLVLRYGDPEDVKLLSSGDEQWTYYSAGRMFKLRRNKIVDVQEFPAMGRFLKN